MSSEIDDFLDHVDQWKFKLHDQLKKLTPRERKAFWKKIHEEAHAAGLRVVEHQAKARRPKKHARPTG
jgi:hypothetical protein